MIGSEISVTGKNFGTQELRKKLRTYYSASERFWEDSLKNNCSNSEYRVPFPEECLGMLCGAKTRSGRPCRNDGVSYTNGRCKFHGGCSTGPRTAEGKCKSALNGFIRKRTP